MFVKLLRGAWGSFNVYLSLPIGQGKQEAYQTYAFGGVFIGRFGLAEMGRRRCG
jgi:hypothetical protein